jgi:hypothetical protein
MKTETDVKKRDGMLREALVGTRDNYAGGHRQNEE